MLWDEAETTISTYVEEQWALGVYAAIPLVFDNAFLPDSGTYMLVNIEGNGADKSIYGTPGYRRSIEAGIVFFHCFVPSGTGKAAAVAPVVTMTGILELKTLDGVIKLDGGNPPSPADPGDSRVPTDQPGGNYYRCSGSVPFIVIGTR